MTKKHQEVFEYIEQQIRNGTIGDGDALPGELELSRTLSVSRNTVRHALNLLAQKYSIERTPGRGTIFHEKNTEDKANKTIGIINSSLMYTIYPELIHGIEDGLYRGGFSMLLANGNYDPEKERESARRMLAHDVAGLIVEPMNSALLTPENEFVRILQSANVPVITTNCTIEDSNASYITMDDEWIGYRAVEYLSGKGHRRIACLFKSDTQAGLLRLAGYYRGLAAAGIPRDENIVCTYTQVDEPVLPGDFFTRKILDGTADDRPTAFLYFNDQNALQSYNAFADYGLSIPDDVSIMGIDNIPEAAHVRPGLTTFNHPKYLMGKLAAEMMLARLGPHNDRMNYGVVMKPDIVERGSIKTLE